MDSMYKGSRPAKFTAEDFSAIYESHIEALCELESSQPRGYHCFMAKLFNDARYVYNNCNVSVYCTDRLVEPMMACSTLLQVQMIF
jgi:hypothetical protein